MIEAEKELIKFGEKGEKSGWTFTRIEADEAQKIKPNTRKSFRIKGKIDQLDIKQLAIIPAGDGSFILPVNSQMRRVLRKEAGSKVFIKIDEDTSEVEISPDLLACLEDEPTAETFFNGLTKGHKRYYSKWIEDAKTIETKTTRISKCLYALANEMDYSQMIRFFKKKKDESRF